MAMLPAPQANLPATTKAYKNAASQKPTGEAHGKQLAFRGDVNGHKCSTADPVATGLRKPSRLRGLALALMQAEIRQAVGASVQVMLAHVPRRFPPPWSVEELDACFVVRDQQTGVCLFREGDGSAIGCQVAQQG